MLEYAMPFTPNLGIKNKSPATVNIVFKTVIAYMYTGFSKTTNNTFTTLTIFAIINPIVSNTRYFVTSSARS